MFMNRLGLFSKKMILLHYKNYRCNQFKMSDRFCSPKKSRFLVFSFSRVPLVHSRGACVAHMRMVVAFCPNMGQAGACATRARNALFRARTG
jgi:hypothetical protein